MRIKKILFFFYAFVLIAFFFTCRMGYPQERYPQETQISLNGLVVDEQGTPVNGADVGLLRSGGEGQKTGPDGKFEITMSPQYRNWGGNGVNDYILVRDAKSGKSAVAAIPANFEETEIKIVLYEPATIKGKVVNKEGKGMVSAAIQCMLHMNRGTFRIAGINRDNRGMTVINTTIDPEGNFTVTDLPGNNIYEISGMAAGYGVETKNNISLKPGQTYDAGTIVLKDANTFISGKVVDGKGKPVAGAEVQVSGEGQQNRNAISKADGTFSIGGLVEGKVRVYAYLRPDPEFGQIQSEQQSDVQTGSKDVEIVIPVIKACGIVLDEQGTPVNGADIGLFSQWTWKQKTGPDGKFEIMMFPQYSNWRGNNGNDYILVRDAKSGKSAVAAIPANFEETEIKIVLYEPATIKGKVVNKEGKEIDSATIQCMLHMSRGTLQVPGIKRDNRGMTVINITSDPEGNFTVTDLPGNNIYEISGMAAGYGVETKNNISLKPGQTYDAGTIVLKDANTFISGKVVDGKGKPVAGAEVQVSGEGQQGKNTTSKADGTFSIGGLVEGKVHVYAYLMIDPEFGQIQSEQQSDVQTGSKDVEIVIPVIKACGIVLDEQGTPVNGADIGLFSQGKWKQKTGIDGKFEIIISPQYSRRGGNDSDSSNYILVRDAKSGKSAVAAVPANFEETEIKIVLH